MIQFGASYLTKTVKFLFGGEYNFYPHPKYFVTSSYQGQEITKKI